jgi:hypothetical protein
LTPTSGEGPFFLSEDSWPEVDTDATSTTPAGVTMFFNVEPGEYQPTATGAGPDTCEPFKWEGDFEIEAKVGVWSSAMFSCGP